MSGLEQEEQGVSTREQQAVERAEKAEKMAFALRQVLLRVPHGTGDHTDLCRMQNEGMAPMDDQNCRCHVGRIRAVIRD